MEDRPTLEDRCGLLVGCRREEEVLALLLTSAVVAAAQPAARLTFLRPNDPGGVEVVRTRGD
eukprot:15440996-Alexandrium_andersonii.AAC.1